MDWFIQYILHHVLPMMSQVSSGSGQALFVMFRFDDISQTYFKIRHQHIAKMPYSSHG